MPMLEIDLSETDYHAALALSPEELRRRVVRIMLEGSGDVPESTRDDPSLENGGKDVGAEFTPTVNIMPDRQDESAD